MPVLYSDFPIPLGSGAGEDEHLVEGTNDSRESTHLFPEDEGPSPAPGQDGHDVGRHGR
jgi:hypothetical protein